MNSNIKKIGISKCLDKDINFFSQYDLHQVIKIPNYMPYINKFKSIIIKPTIELIKIINSAEGLSAEGCILTKKKLVVKIILQEKILYLSESYSHNSHIIENSFYRIAYIPVPESIEGVEISSLLNKSNLDVNAFIEDVTIAKLNNRKIDKHVFALITCKIKLS